MKRGTGLVFLIVACGRPVDTVALAPPPDGASSSGGPATPAGPCDPANAADIEVVSNDLMAYPPYAAAGCDLVYVAPTGALMKRNLSTGIDSEVASAASRPRRPSMSTELIAYEGIDRNGVSVVYVTSVDDPPDTTRSAATIPGPFTFAGEPRVSGKRVSFTGWNGATESDDTAVFLYDDTLGGDAKMILGGAGQQRFSDVSDAFVAASDFAEDPDGRYDGDGNDLADIVVYEIATGAVTKRPAAGKQAFPMLTGGDLVAYLHWSAVHPEPKLQAYELRVGRVGDDAANDRTLANVSYLTASPVRPAAANGTIEWISNPDGTTVLWRAAADGSSAPAAVAGLDGLRLYAPAPAAGFTLLASEPASGGTLAPRLRVVNR